ncbi:MAG: laccase domain protein [Betaproteobacteria bacterium]|nr:MAG: laccase domain protein [Betaproteobacteria bacterium]
MTLAARLAAAGLDWIVPAWDAPPQVHAFATTRGARDGSVDVGPAHPGALDGRSRSRVLASRAAVAGFLPGAPVFLEQVHGRRVAVVDAATLAAFRAAPPVADAAVTRLPDVPLAVRTADCLPVLLAADDGSVVAAAHAGWRGLAAGVIEATLAAMAVPPSRVVAWLGPAIGPRAFEVGEDVREAFAHADAGAAAHFAPRPAGKWLADLPALARRRLARAGVGRVAACGACTVTDAARFHSWRRDRSRERMGTFVWRAPGLQCN